MKKCVADGYYIVHTALGYALLSVGCYISWTSSLMACGKGSQVDPALCTQLSQWAHQSFLRWVTRRQPLRSQGGQQCGSVYRFRS